MSATIATIIQLGLDPQDNRLFWVDMHLWDERDATPGTVQRPTETAAFRNLFRQSRLLSKRGVFINLTPLHLTAMRLEHQAMSTPPTPKNVYAWVSERMGGVSHLQVKALLDECSLVVLLRDAFSMPALPIEWELPAVAKRAA